VIDQALSFSPPLADKIAVKTATASAQEIALQILSEIRPDIYAAHPHAELKKLASGAAVQELQAELNRLRSELAGFQCPYCGSPLVESQQVPLDHEQRDWDMIRGFECGYVEIAGGTQRPCPSDPQFPRLSDYDLKCREDSGSRGTLFQWTCDAFPKTVMAHAVRISTGYGPTEADALQHVSSHYDRLAQRWDA
jgi:hypothetical protein